MKLASGNIVDWPGQTLDELADETGNLNAIACGANLLFCDLLPDAQADAFRPIDQRHVSGLQHCEAVAQLSGLTLDLGGE